LVSEPTTRPLRAELAAARAAEKSRPTLWSPVGIVVAVSEVVLEESDAADVDVVPLVDGVGCDPPTMPQPTRASGSVATKVATGDRRRRGRPCRAAGRVTDLASSLRAGLG
jgi:hypothetical protein